MKRREFIAAAGMTLGTGRPRAAAAPDESAAIQQRIKDSYSFFYTDRNTQKYRSLLTDDYLLLENGEIMDVERESALMPAPAADYKRSDTFDFRRVTVRDDIGYVVYIVTSRITSGNKPAQNGVQRFLESAILRRSARGWQIALMHSTQIRARSER
jgi:hypothetical protein